MERWFRGRKRDGEGFGARVRVLREKRSSVAIFSIPAEREGREGGREREELR